MKVECSCGTVFSIQSETINLDLLDLSQHNLENPDHTYIMRDKRRPEWEIRKRLETLENRQEEGSIIMRNITQRYRLLQIQVLKWVLDIE